MKTQIIITLKFLAVMTILTGILYPFFMTEFAQLMFPAKANGSLLKKDGKIIGSVLIGQKFDSSIYFWSRPSANNYNPIPSGASNLGPTSYKLKTQVILRKKEFILKNGLTDSIAIPKELLFASASGLDPHISPDAALLQLKRVATARKLNESQTLKVKQLIKNMTEEPQFSLFGESRINVLVLNLKLDKLK
jgi:potassium-transporting ATPase KdpC subunit